jgi:hypothetical protein
VQNNPYGSASFSAVQPPQKQANQAANAESTEKEWPRHWNRDPRHGSDANRDHSASLRSGNGHVPEGQPLGWRLLPTRFGFKHEPLTEGATSYWHLALKLA